MDRFPRANFLLASTCRTHRGTDRITNQYDNGFIPVEVDCSPQDSSKASGTFSAFFLTYLRTASCCGVLGCDTVPRCAGMWHCTAVCWDVTPYRGVLGCDTVPWCAGMWHCTVVCWDVTLYCGVLGCDTVLRDHEYSQFVGTFCLHLSSAPKMEAVWFSETLVPVYQT